MAENTEQNEVMINMQYIKDMSLEVPHAPKVFAKLNTPPEIGIDLNIDTTNLGNDQYEVTLNLRINANTKDEPLFIYELSYAAACTVKIAEEQKEPLLFIEIPRLIFPFARQVVSTNLSEAGLPPLMLSPVDFAAVYRSKKAQQQTNSKEAAN
ncbi:MAG: protein-export chaperone SecB [Alphaproteobacteria bacterium]|nr:protein-export chaperone SecB [Alphaproteobacteria bacterium]